VDNKLGKGSRMTKMSGKMKRRRRTRSRGGGGGRTLRN
jgi:hypothetical protein